MDIITYALCKKIANGAASGITDVRIDGLNLILTTKDGIDLVMTFPTPKDGISVTNLSIDENNHLNVLLSNGTIIDAGVISAVKGDKGEQGLTGYSPTITVKENTNESYILTIQNETTSYDTPNLKGGASSFAILEGTLDNPIDLSLLDYGIYYIKGYFKKDSSSEIQKRNQVTMFTVTEDDSTLDKIIIYNKIKNSTPFTIIISYSSDGIISTHEAEFSQNVWDQLEPAVDSANLAWDTL